jgi:MFS family permease
VSSSDDSAAQLDDEQDREELRSRYYGLMQELRVVLPGVQVLVGFLLTVPFATRFSELDSTAETFYGVALVSAMLSVVAFVAPTAFHRLGDRRARSARLSLAIRLTRAGIALLAVALVCAMYVVARFVFDNTVGLLLSSISAVAMLVLWFLTPLHTRWPQAHDEHDSDAPIED